MFSALQFERLGKALHGNRVGEIVDKSILYAFLVVIALIVLGLGYVVINAKLLNII
jgi:hypothetical protein